MNDYPKPEKIELGGRYTATFQQLEWICSFCGADNTTDQKINDYDDLYDPLCLVCDVCGIAHETPKTILKK